MKILVLVTCLVAINVFAGDIKRGEMLYDVKTTPELKAEGLKGLNCFQCHGKIGEGRADKKDGKYKLSAMKGPRIANLSEEYIVEQLKAIHDKSRKTKYTNTMALRIAKSSEKDFQDLAAYVSQLNGEKPGSYTSEVWDNVAKKPIE